MPAPHLMYATVKKICYPIFAPKLRQAEGLEHLPQHGGYILAANHVDWLDGFYIAVAVGVRRNTPVYFLSQSGTYWWTSLIVKIPRNRSQAVEVAAQYLRRGQVICNFPEGQRNTRTALLPGRTGTVRMAIAAGVPVVPVGIACDAGRNVAQSLQFVLSSQHPIRLRFGAPLTFDDLGREPSKEALQAATSRLMERIAALSDKTIS